MRFRDFWTPNNNLRRFPNSDLSSPLHSPVFTVSLCSHCTGEKTLSRYNSANTAQNHVIFHRYLPFSPKNRSKWHTSIYAALGSITNRCRRCAWCKQMKENTSNFEAWSNRHFAFAGEFFYLFSNLNLSTFQQYNSQNIIKSHIRNFMV